MNLHAKFRLTVAVASIGLLTLSGFWLRSERSGLIAEKEEQARNLVSTPYSIIQQQYRLEMSGKISRAEAQNRAVETISAIRYDRDNYYWINDLHPRSHLTQGGCVASLLVRGSINRPTTTPNVQRQVTRSIL